MVESVDGTYGLNADGGMIGMLARDQIDLGVAGFSTLIPERNQVATGLIVVREFG